MCARCKCNKGFNPTLVGIVSSTTLTKEEIEKGFNPTLVGIVSILYAMIEKIKFEF